MDITPGQHLRQPLFAVVIKAATVPPFGRILIGAEEHVPPGDVTVVVPVMPMTMVDAMHFWPLEHKSDPTWRPDIGVIEEFTQRSAQRIDAARLKRQAKQRVDQQAADY